MIDTIFYVILLVLLFTSAMSTMMPYLTMPTIQFSVRLQENTDLYEKVLAMRPRYMALSLLVTALVVISLFFAYQFYQIVAIIVWPFLDIVLLFLVYYAFHLKALRMKREAGPDLTSGVIASSAVVEQEPKRVNPYLLFIPWIELAVFVMLGLYYFPQIPNVFPTHYGANGVPNQFSLKSYSSAFTLLIYVGIPITAFLEILSILFIRVRPFQNPEYPGKTSRQMGGFNRLLVNFLIFVLIIMNLSFFFSSAMEWGLIGHQYLILDFMPVFFVLPAAVYISVKAGQGGWKLYPQVRENPTGNVARNDDSQWIGGVMYFNRNDSSLLVPKRFGVGYTVNFAHPVGWLILLIPILVPIVILIIRFHII